MSAEVNNYSSTLEPSSALVIALEQTGSSVVTGSDVQLQSAGSSAKSYMVATAAPTLKQDAIGTVTGLINSVELQNQELDQEQFDILMQETLLQIINESDSSDFDAKSFIDGFKEQMAEFENTSSPEESSSKGGTTNAEANKNLAMMAMMMNSAVTAASQVQLEQTRETQVASDQNIEMLNSQRDIQDQNYDQQAQNAQKQSKIHKWTRIGKWTAAVTMVVATAIVVGPGAAAMAVAVLGAMKAMQATGAMDAIQNINSPALRALAEAGVVVAVTAAAATGGALIDGGIAYASDAAGDAIQKAAVKSAAASGVMAASTSLMDTGSVELYAQGLTSLIFTIGRLDKDSKAFNRTKMSIQASLTIALVVGTIVTLGAAGGVGSNGVSFARMIPAITSSAISIATNSTGIPEGILGMDMGKLKEQAAYIQAGYEEALATSQANLQLGKQTQEQERKQIESMQEAGYAALKELSAPLNAIARALQA